MSDSKEQKTDVDGASVHPLVIRLFKWALPRCWDCKGVLWPWQERGIDESSHRVCHHARVRDYREQLRADGDTEMLSFLSREERQIEDVYNG